MSLFQAKGETRSFQRLPEGHQTLVVSKVDYDPEFFDENSQIVEVYLQNKDGIEHKERFNFAIDAGAKALTFLVKAAHNRWDIKEGEDIQELIDTLVGKFFECDVEYVESKKINPRTEKPYVNARLNNKRSCKPAWDFVPEQDDDDNSELEETGVDAETFQF